MKRVTADPNWAFQASDAAILRALEGGTHSDSLREFFGLDLYTDLSNLAEQAAALRAQRNQRRGAKPAQRVLILPGIMGSKLGTAQGAKARGGVLWIDPLRIAAGQLTRLALPRGAKLQPLGVLLFTYAKLKLMLDIGGCDAHFHAYDWRCDVSLLGAQLARRIEGEAAPPVLVAHSMGGLVARAALALLPRRAVRRLILVGTPHAGTYAAVQALCGSYPTVRKIAMLDLKHSPEFLARHVFSTFPGLYQLLPPRSRTAQVDVHDPRRWPRATRPDPALLARAEHVRDTLPPPDERFRQIAGFGQETIVGIGSAPGGFSYDLAVAGDGTVPLASALLPGVPAWYVAEIHGNLVGNAQVIHCIQDLIRTGRSARLPQQRPRTRGKQRHTDDRALRRQVHGKIHWRALDSAGRERLLLQFSGNPAPAIPPQPRRTLELCIAQGNIADARGDAIVLGIFRNVTPGGAAMAVDQRLDGAVQEFTARRMFSGETGQIFTLPAGTRRLRARTVLFAGMGDFDRFDVETQIFVSENVVRTLARARVADFSTVLLGTGSGISMAQAAGSQLRGYLRALAAADPDHQLRRISFCVRDRPRLPQLRAALRSALRELQTDELLAGFDITLRETHLPPAPRGAMRPESRKPIPTPARASAPATTAYLILAQESAQDSAQESGRARGRAAPCVRASLLTAGAKAVVFSSHRRVERAALDELLNDLRGSNFTAAQLRQYGERMGRLLLAPDLREALHATRTSHLAIVHDAELSQLPWETLRIGDWTPALTAGVSRRYAAENLSVARWSETRRLGETLELLLVADPTGDLPGARAEAQRLIQLFAGHPRIRLHVVQGNQATRARLMSDFRSGAYDVLHYAGHAHFDADQPGRSGIYCAGGEILCGADLARLESLPALVFFNACESGRLRAAPRHRLRQSLLTVDGLAESFLRGGVANYLGTYWPVGDESALAFSSTLYSGVVAGTTLGAAVNRARDAVRRAHSCDWADYMHYGNHEFGIKGV